MTGAEAVVNVYLARLHPFIPLEDLARAAQVERADLVAEVHRRSDGQRRARPAAVPSSRPKGRPKRGSR